MIPQINYHPERNPIRNSQMNPHRPDLKRYGNPMSQFTRGTSFQLRTTELGAGMMQVYDFGDVKFHMRGYIAAGYDLILTSLCPGEY